MEIDSGLDVLIWILCIVVGLNICLGGISKVTKYMAVQRLPDKTLVKVYQGEDPEEYEWTVRDYLLMLMVADDLAPEPRAVDIQFGNSQMSTLVEFDTNYFKKMEANLQQYYINYLNNRIDTPIESYDYYRKTGEKDRWRFKTAGN